MKTISPVTQKFFKQDIQLLSISQLENTSSTYANFLSGYKKFGGYEVIGVIGHVLHNDDYTLFELDKFDTEYVSKTNNLKSHQFVFRYETERSRQWGIKSLLKIDLKTEMVYFLSDLADLNDEAIFEKRGTKLRFMKALQSSFSNEIC